MRFLAAIYYLIRRLWFGLFPRKVGAKGALPVKASALGVLAPLPTPPRSWTAPRMRWGWLGNDVKGDCVIAGIMHAIMAVGKFLKIGISFTTQQAENLYFALTGGPDIGLSPDGTLNDWQVGQQPIESLGKAGPFVYLDPTNSEQIKQAIAAFGWVGFASQLQQAQEDQFSRGQRWQYVEGSPVVGGHFVIGIGYDAHNVGPYIVSWAKGFRATWEWVGKTCYGAYTGILPPVNAAGKYVEDLATLDAALSGMKEI
jgi:hypothetical protein